jgi:hypothetical protein
MKLRVLVIVLVSVLISMSGCNRNVCPTFSHPAVEKESKSFDLSATISEEREH